MRVVCVGAGIGGLAGALAFALRGHSVTVLERAEALTEVGAGLQISPNGWRVLDALGVAPALAPLVFAPEAIEMRVGSSGAEVFSLPLGAYACLRWGAPYVHVHRADMVAALEGQLLACAPGAIKTGCCVSGYAQSNSEVSVQLRDGTSIAADLVIGADGIHSVLRMQMLGPDRPRYTGNVAWRAVVPLDALGSAAPPPTACVWVGHKKHAVTTRLRAGRMANFVGMIETPEPAPEDWRTTGTAEQAARDFDGWDPVISTLIDKAGALHRWALFDRKELPRWRDGRVALLGDAAHPMLPSMAQGAVQALEDAWILAQLVDKSEDIPGALAAYEALRKPRTTRIQRGSAANARLFHHAHWAGRWAFYGPMSIVARLAPDLLHRRQDWVYGYDPLAAVAP